MSVRQNYCAPNAGSEAETSCNPPGHEKVTCREEGGGKKTHWS